MHAQPEASVSGSIPMMRLWIGLSAMALEWEVVCYAHLWRCRCWSDCLLVSWLRLLVGRLWLIRLWLLMGGLRHLLGLWVDDVPCSNVGVPAPVELSALEVDRDSHLLPYLHGELVDVVAEEVEADFAWVLSVGLEYVILLLPCVSRLRCALLQGLYLDDRSYDF